MTKQEGSLFIVILFLPLQKKFRQRFERNRVALENFQRG
jgi:hypothetical protein